jgi:hypothetical protein
MRRKKVGAKTVAYSYFVEKLARQSFANVQNHNYDEVLKSMASLAPISSPCGGVRFIRSMCLRTLRPWPQA